MKPEVVVPCGCELAEGPLWDDASGVLHWVDILAGRLFTLDLVSGDVTHVDTGAPLGAVALTEDGPLLAAREHGFGLLHEGRVEPIGVQFVPDGLRMNDGGCDPLGRFWAGTLANDGSPGAGSLYRLESDGEVTTVLEHVTESNGIDWSPDGDLMYFVDSGTQRVDVFDFGVETGEVSNRRPFVSVGPSEVPDGLTVDASGCVWVAVWGGSQVRRFTPDGHLDAIVELPVANVTNATFGGPDLSTLFITTAWHALSESERRTQPLAGDVFAVDAGVSGVPARRCRWQ
jgi:sugar lactone lactonase YvrE